MSRDSLLNELYDLRKDLRDFPKESPIYKRSEARIKQLNLKLFGTENPQEFSTGKRIV